MYVKNLATGEIETLPFGPATDAVNSGAYEFVNLNEDGKEKGGDAVFADPAFLKDKPANPEHAPVPVTIVADETKDKAKK